MYRVFSGPQGSRQGIFMVFKKNIQKTKAVPLQNKKI